MSDETTQTGQDPQTGAGGTIQPGWPTPPPTQPPRPKTSNDSLFQRFLVHPLTTFDEKHFMELLEHSLSLSTFEKNEL